MSNKVQIDYRRAKQGVDTGIGGCKSIEEEFKRVRHYPFFVDSESEQLYLRLLVKGIVSTLLDPLTLHSSCARTLVSSILSDIILKNAVVDRLSEPWMIYEILLKTANISSQRKGEARKQSDKATSMEMPLSKKSVSSQVGQMYNSIIKGCASLTAKGGNLLAFLVSISTTHPYAEDVEINPLAVRRIFPLLNNMLALSDRNPLFYSTIHTLAIPFRRGLLADISTKTGSYFISKYIRNENLVVMILRIGRETLFPGNGLMGAPRVIPNQQEQQATKQALGKSISELIPDAFRNVTLGRSERVVDEFLEVFCNKSINKYLIYSLLEYIAVTVLPELKSTTPDIIFESKAPK